MEFDDHANHGSRYGLNQPTLHVATSASNDVVARLNAPINRQSSVEAKIRLFRSLFRGRGDIYARRFESRKTGKSGYAPACANEWVRGICEKPRIKCAECPHLRISPKPVIDFTRCRSRSSPHAGR